MDPGPGHCAPLRGLVIHRSLVWKGSWLMKPPGFIKEHPDSVYYFIRWPAPLGMIALMTWAWGVTFIRSCGVGRYRQANGNGGPTITEKVTALRVNVHTVHMDWYYYIIKTIAYL